MTTAQTDLAFDESRKIIQRSGDSWLVLQSFYRFRSASDAG